MVNKGMVNKGKYWIYGKNNGIPVYNFEEPKGRNKGIQYSAHWIYKPASVIRVAAAIGSAAALSRGWI